MAIDDPNQLDIAEEDCADDSQGNQRRQAMEIEVQVGLNKKN